MSTSLVLRLFDWVGPARGGDAPHGGIFWTHPVEWGAGLESPWGQIVRHAPQPEPRLLPGWRWAIELGARDGRVAALVRSSARQRWRPEAEAPSRVTSSSLRPSTTTRRKLIGLPARLTLELADAENSVAITHRTRAG